MVLLAVDATPPMAMENTNVRFNKKQMRIHLGKLPLNAREKLLNTLERAYKDAKTEKEARKRTTTIISEFMKKNQFIAHGEKNTNFKNMIFYRRKIRLYKIYNAIPSGTFEKGNIPSIPKYKFFDTIDDVDSPFMINFNTVAPPSNVGVAGGVVASQIDPSSETFGWKKFRRLVDKVINEKSTTETNQNPHAPRYYSCLACTITATTYEVDGNENGRTVFVPIEGNWDVGNFVKQHMLELPPYNAQKNNTTVLFITYIVDYWPEIIDRVCHSTLAMITLTRRADKVVFEISYIDSFDCGHDRFQNVLHTAKDAILTYVYSQPPMPPYDPNVTTDPVKRRDMNFSAYTTPNPIDEEVGDCWALSALTAMFIQKNNFTTTYQADYASYWAMQVPQYKRHMETLIKNTVATAAVIPPHTPITTAYLEKVHKAPALVF